MELLDLTSALQRDLDELPGLSMVDGKALLRRARELLVRARDAAVLAGNSSGDASWNALRLGFEEVSCWKGNGAAMLSGRWNEGMLTLMHVRIGDRSWSVRHTAHGDSRASSDGQLEGPADRRLFAEASRRAAEQLGEWERSHPHPWSCPRCSWNNEEQAAACAICGAPSAAAMAGPTSPSLGADWGTAARLPTEIPNTGNVLELAASDVFALDRLLGSVREGQFEVVLRRVPADRKISVVQMVRETSGEGSLAKAKELVERVPCVVRAGLSQRDAEGLMKRLQSTGADVEIREAQ